jgi:hypothetical protein
MLRCAPTMAQAAAACGRRRVLAGTELLRLRRRSLDQTQDHLVYPDSGAKKWSAPEPWRSKVHMWPLVAAMFADAQDTLKLCRSGW